MTAGHNIKRPVGSYAKSILVTFENSLEFEAKPTEYFVSSTFDIYISLEGSKDSSVSDYGLITVSRDRINLANPNLDLFGCAFSASISNTALFQSPWLVYGYLGGETKQTGNPPTSKWVREDQLIYDQGASAGLSGGPVFITRDSPGNYVAVGIHNYKNKATRLTFPVICEMISWIKDYGLACIIMTVPESGRDKLPERYIRATDGYRPNILAVYDKAYCTTFKFIVVDALKNPGPESSNGEQQTDNGYDLPVHHYQFAIVPRDRLPEEKQATPSMKKGYFLSVSAQETAILSAGVFPGSESIFRLYRKAERHRSLLARIKDLEDLTEYLATRITNEVRMAEERLDKKVTDLTVEIYKVDQKVIEEEKSRKAGDENIKETIRDVDRILQDKINGEISDRTRSDNASKENLAAEQASRESTDAAIRREIVTAIDNNQASWRTEMKNEQERRENAENSLEQNLKEKLRVEQSARETAIDQLQDDLRREARGRSEAEDKLQTDITNAKKDLTQSFETSLQAFRR
ncbi:hypothetical protein H072_10941 [Dactylellina haptotyla CBS 200.50]|uniref:Peptidase S1 domain-containing protein n=1 Tax=Dactylellina haptotyla (strain CBS 200.50) TaxID=1284197 RepID=S7ZXZ2_DACHA|nr:hypothetical protein H072_10941 [Dactylellina haptotyla CBS 200.50]